MQRCFKCTGVRRSRIWEQKHARSRQQMEKCRDTCASKKKLRAVLLDTKGPEIRTAMLRDGANILLEEGQEVVMEAVGSQYTEFQGYKTTDETRIGLSYPKLCQSVTPGNRILLADGIEVLEILNATEIKGRVMNTKELGQRKNCNLPGVHVDLPVLMEKESFSTFRLAFLLWCAVSLCSRTERPSGLLLRGTWNNPSQQDDRILRCCTRSDCWQWQLVDIDCSAGHR
jgi:pyruvate kinase